MNIPLYVGNAPDKTAFTMSEQDDYYQLVAELPKLHEQGDGMRSFASILLNTFTSDYSITLIDEPEAFFIRHRQECWEKCLQRIIQVYGISKMN